MAVEGWGAETKTLNSAKYPSLKAREVFDTRTRVRDRMGGGGWVGGRVGCERHLRGTLAGSINERRAAAVMDAARRTAKKKKNNREICARIRETEAEVSFLYFRCICICMYIYIFFLSHKVILKRTRVRKTP